MKRLLLHVGYPKAASTSLQNGLFLKLHNEKAINFLGRAFESGFYGTRRGKGDYKEWSTSVVGGKPYDAENSLGPLSEEMPNVLSEGFFMLNERHGDRFASPQLLRDYFSSQADSIDVLIVIRKQSDLVPSYFTQTYHRLGAKSFAHYLAQNTKQGWRGEAKIFDLYSVAKAYADVFGKDRVHVVLFEDFVHDKDRFSTQLGAAMGLDPAVIRRHLGDSHLNKTASEAGQVLLKKINPRSPRFLLMRLLRKLGLQAAADRLKLKIPSATDAEKKALADAFGQSNRELADEFLLNKQAMQGYGYFPADRP